MDQVDKTIDASDTKQRCPWCGTDPLYVAYHDTEWGVPVHDEVKHFEFLLLEGFQAGLSWATILKKREAFRQAFNGFEPEKIAAYDDKKLAALRENPAIIRNRAKIAAARKNAQAFLKVQADYGTFDEYIWGFVDYTPRHNGFEEIGDIPAVTPLSEKISQDLKSKGFSFVGPTIIYAHMQAIGLVNDHLVSCFRYGELIG